MLHVLVVDDSASVRAQLIDILSSAPGIHVVGEARNGEEAVAMTRKLRPHVVTMDVDMPKLGGLAATERIMTETPTPILIVAPQAKQERPPPPHLPTS